MLSSSSYEERAKAAFLLRVKHFITYPLSERRAPQRTYTTMSGVTIVIATAESALREASAEFKSSCDFDTTMSGIAITIATAERKCREASAKFKSSCDFDTTMSGFATA